MSLWDMQGNACGLEGSVTADYPYIYFATPHPDYLTRTVCVKECPWYELTDGEDANLLSSFALPFEETYHYDSDGNTVAGKDMLDCYINSGDGEDGEWEYNVGTCEDGCFPDWNDINWTTMEVTWSWDRMTCVYNTTAVLDKICIPSGDIVSALGEEFEAAFASAGGNSATGDIMADLNIGYPVVFGSIGIALVVGLIYMGFLMIFAGVIVWIMVAIYFALIGYITYMFYASWNTCV